MQTREQLNREDLATEANARESKVKRSEQTGGKEQMLNSSCTDGEMQTHKAEKSIVSLPLRVLRHRHCFPPHKQTCQAYAASTCVSRRYG